MSDPMQPHEPSAGQKDRRSRNAEQWLHRPMDKYRKDKHALPFRPTAAFFARADPLVESKRTLLGYDRLYLFWQTVLNVAHVPGAAAEVGSFRGGSAFFIAQALCDVLDEEVPMHVFDTFEGHPADAITEHDPHHVAGQFGSTSVEDVRDFLSPFRRLEIHEGDVSVSLPRLQESLYRLVHVDTDLYQPTRVCLDYFGERMSPGGVIIVDDYASRKCPGVPKAVAEYLDGTDGFQAWDMRTEQLMLVKR